VTLTLSLSPPLSMVLGWRWIWKRLPGSRRRLAACLYRFDAPKQSEPVNQVETLTIVEHDPARLAQMKLAPGGRSDRSGVFLARDLVNLPPMLLPNRMAEAARQLQ